MEDPVVRSRAIAAAAEAGMNISLAELERSLRRPRTLLSFLVHDDHGAADPGGPGAAVLRGLHAGGTGPAQAQSGQPSLASAGRAWRGRRLRQCHPRHLDHGGNGRADQRALRDPGRGLSGRDRAREPGWRRSSVSAPRCSAVSLRSWPACWPTACVVLVTGSFSAFAGGGRPVDPDAAHRDAHGRGRHPHGARPRSAKRPSAWGPRRTQVIWYVMLPTAMPGILTGVMLASPGRRARRPRCLFTALFSNYWPIDAHGHFDLSQNTASLAVLIYNFSSIAVREPDRSGLGRRLGSGVAGADHQSHRPRPLAAQRRNRSSCHDPVQSTLATTAAPASGGAQNDVVIDCNINELYYGTFKAVRDTQDPHPERTASRPSSAPRAAARAPCSAA